MCKKVKKCGDCNKIDGLLYLSYPPQVKCTITNKYHCLDDKCDITTHDNPELLKGGVDNAK